VAHLRRYIVIPGLVPGTHVDGRAGPAMTSRGDAVWAYIGLVGALGGREARRLVGERMEMDRAIGESVIVWI
jgi:hypothetical protein